MSSKPQTICDRLRLVRVRHYGERGRSRLCRELGITPSTYTLYEISRIPPVELLASVASLAGVSLDWLITGAGDASSADTQNASVNSLKKQQLIETPALKHHKDKSEPPVLSPAMTDWIPVVGSTAAGKARFWEELTTTHGGREADARLETILAEYGTQSAGASSLPGDLNSPAEEPRLVSLVQFSTPDNRGFLEFLSAARIKGRYPRAIAWRIDGESMSPRYLDGDLVVTSVDHPAVSGHPCVARQKGQIGVNCKIYQETDREILLIPIHESSRIQRLSHRQLLWAYRVLCSVRMGSREI